MLNPGASEFKPTFTPPATDPTDHDLSKTNGHSSIRNNQSASHQPTNKNRNKQKGKNKPSATIPTLDKNTADPSTLPTKQKNTSRPSKKSTLGSQQDPSSSSRRKQQQTPTQQKTRRPQPKTPTTHTINSIHEQPATSFITIDQTIDPVYVVMQNTPSLQKNTLVHGYDPYVAWIERCLQAYSVVTIVGMDPAIADVISLVTMVQLAGIGSYHELDTFSMVEDERQPTCGIQIKLHRNG